MTSRKIAVSTALLCTLIAPTIGESKMSCFRARGSETRRLMGYILQVKPDPDEYGCRAVIQSPKGETIFETQDTAIGILQVTGKDINGDGQLDAVLEGFSGGAHCCWTYSIVSLGKPVGLLREFKNRRPATFEDIANDGKIEIVTRDGAFDEFDDLMHPFSPFPLLVLRLAGRRLIEVNAEFSPLYKQEIAEARNKLTPQKIERFRLAQLSDLEYQETKSWVLAIVLAYLYGGREEEAWKALDELWPPTDEERIHEDILYKYSRGFRWNLD